MNTIIRFAASALVLTLCAAWPRAALAECAGAPALAKMARAGRLTQSAPLQTEHSVPWDGRPDVDRRTSIVGLWQVTFMVDGVVTDIGFDAWHGDGTETLNDAAPIAHNICLGVWQQTGRRTYQLKHPAFRYDAAGNVIGTLVLRETNVVERGGARFTGEFTIQFFDLAGTLEFEGAGQILGERITVD